MITPALSFEAILTAMMCLCSSEDNAAKNMYQTDVIDEIYQRTLGSSTTGGGASGAGAGVSVSFVKNEVNELQERLDTLNNVFGEIQMVQENIMKLLNISSGIPVDTGAAVASCTTKRQISNVQVPKYPHPFQVLCNGERWLIIQQRFDGSVNFFRSWSDYERGFGTLHGEFFIGLEKLHAITTAQPQELRIELEDFDKDMRFAHYDQFEIGSANDGYNLKILGKYDGNAGDSLRRHVSHKFSTYDRDNDIYEGHCAVDYSGAWWYDECETSNLNGQYLGGKISADKYGKGISWDTFRGLEYSLKSVKMMIRPKV